MWLKIAILALAISSACLADKPAAKVVARKKPIEEKPVVKAAAASTITTSSKVVEKAASEKVDKVADERSDTVVEKSSTASQGNLYYYYYPVAAYPIHANEKVSSTSASSHGSSNNFLDSPIIYIGIPLVLLAIAAGVISVFFTQSTTVSSGRSLKNRVYRNADLDEKFGSFAELQAEIDHQLSKYMAALDSDNCMDRIVCELGTKASTIPQKDLFFRYSFASQPFVYF